MNRTFDVKGAILELVAAMAVNVKVTYEPYSVPTLVQKELRDETAEGRRGELNAQTNKIEQETCAKIDAAAWKLASVLAGE